MLEALIARYGLGGMVSARPYIGEDGKTLLWVLKIEGERVEDADLRVEQLSAWPDWTAVILVHGDEEVELGRWSHARDRYGPAEFVRSLRELRQVAPLSAPKRRRLSLLSAPRMGGPAPTP